MKPSKVIPAVASALALAAIVVIPAISGAEDSGTIALNSGFMPDPRMLMGNSGGTMSASAMGGGCRGYIHPEPDHHLFLSTDFSWLRIFVRSGGDTTLIVRGPLPAMTTRCNDDTFGLNPSIEGPWAQGQYHIWVGSYSPGTARPFQVGFTEIRSVH